MKIKAIVYCNFYSATSMQTSNLPFNCPRKALSLDYYKQDGVIRVSDKSVVNNLFNLFYFYRFLLSKIMCF